MKRRCEWCYAGVMRIGDSDLIIKKAWNKPVSMFSYSLFQCDKCIEEWAKDLGVHPKMARDIQFWSNIHEVLIQKIKNEISKSNDEESGLRLVEWVKDRDRTEKKLMIKLNKRPNEWDSISKNFENLMRSRVFNTELVVEEGIPFDEENPIKSAMAIIRGFKMKAMPKLK